MPPKSFAKKNKKNWKTVDRRVAGFDEIKARNIAEPYEGGLDAIRKEREGKEGSSDDEDDSKVYVKPKTNAFADGFERAGLNDDAPKQPSREELKEIKKRQYEKLHKEGKTEEAQADMKRLEKIKKEREEAKIRREQEVAKKAEAAAGGKKANTEYNAALGGEEARKRGGGKKKKDKKDDKDDKDEDKDEEGGDSEKETKDEAATRAKVSDGVDLYSAYRGAGTAAPVIPDSNAKAGTMEACRAAEDDFM